MTTEPPRVAVAIPAFKGRHLAQTLESLARQTDRGFRVYVGDDASPENLADIVAGYRARLDLVYRRFPGNLGATSLARQWDRTVELGDEPWVWLFSDDDAISPECVAELRAACARNGGAPRLYRFHTVCIDATGAPVRRNTDYPARATWTEFVEAALDVGRAPLVPEQNVAFAREVHRREGGFADYPWGMWSDLVTWARFARHGGIETLARGKVQYRIHAEGIGPKHFPGRVPNAAEIRQMARALADLSTLYAAEGRWRPALRMLVWFAWRQRYAAEPPGREAARALAENWPGWPGVREAVFWWHACRPWVRRALAVTAVTRGAEARR